MKLIPKHKTSKTEKTASERAPRARAKAENDSQSQERRRIKNETRSQQMREKQIEEIVRKEPAVRKVIKAAAKLADFIEHEDRAESMEVIRNAKRAMHHIYDQDLHKLVEVPDHKIRLAAVALERPYDEGSPIKRTVTLTGDFQSAEQLIERLQSSPEALKAIMGSGIQVAVDGEVIEGEFTTVRPDETKQNSE